MCGSENKKNPFLGLVDLCARMNASLIINPMLSINCPIPAISYGPYSHTEYLPQPYTLAHVIYFSYPV